MSAEESNCGTCKHFRRTTGTFDLDQGQCWCMPPQAVPAMQGGAAGLMAIRVPVTTRMLCGQWTAKPAEIAKPK